LTFFNVVASLEIGARARGGKGLVAWFGKLPWGDPSLAAQVLAMLLFAFGGIGGLVNASHSMNLIVHNTAYIVGHFHLTVGTAVTLSFMGITYWLVPYLSGRALWSRKLALTQVWLWAMGMTVFSSSLHHLGLQGMPRRTMISMAMYIQPEWRTAMILVGIGGTVMFISAMIYFFNIVLTAVVSRQPAPEAPAFAEAVSGVGEAPLWLDRLRPWLVLSAILILIAYGPVLIDMVGHGLMHVRGVRVW
jgi:cytochrome c oxidase subunit I